MPLNTPSPLSLWSAPRRKVERSTLSNPFFAKDSCLDRESITVSTSSRALDQFSHILITMSASNWVLWNRILTQRYFFPPTRMSFLVPEWWSNRVWTRVFPINNHVTYNCAVRVARGSLSILPLPPSPVLRRITHLQNLSKLTDKQLDKVRRIALFIQN